MPNLLDVLRDPASLIVFALFGGLVLWEALRPARVLPHVKGWRAMGLAGFVVFFLLSTYLPCVWADHLGSLRIADFSGCGTAGGAMCAVMVYEAGAYAYHFAMDRVGVLWRLLHLFGTFFNPRRFARPPASVTARRIASVHCCWRAMWPV